MKVVCVGGPCDGQRIDIEPDQAYVRVIVPILFMEMDFSHADEEAYEVQTADYKVHRIRSKERNHIFLAPINVEFDDALTRLFNGYRKGAQ